MDQVKFTETELAVIAIAVRTFRLIAEVRNNVQPETLAVIKSVDEKLNQ